MPAPGLSREDLPAAYREASDYSQRAQRSATRWLAAQLGLLGAGALVGAVDAETAGGIHLGALAAAVSLALATVPAVFLAMRNPQRGWYRGRAAAESVKTLAWKYSVGATPFTGDGDDDGRLEQDMGLLRRELPEVPLGGGPAITGAMRRLRAAGLPERRRVFLAERIDAERDWYTAKAAWNARSARWWSSAAIAATVLGIAGGFLKAFGVVDYDGLGAACAVAAAATAWMQLKQFRPLAAAYSLTAQELNAVREKLAAVVDETLWAATAAGAEEAISREHTTWIARREAV